MYCGNKAVISAVDRPVLRSAVSNCWNSCAASFALPPFVNWANAASNDDRSSFVAPRDSVPRVRSSSLLTAVSKNAPSPENAVSGFTCSRVFDSARSWPTLPTKSSMSLNVAFSSPVNRPVTDRAFRLLASLSTSGGAPRAFFANSSIPTATTASTPKLPATFCSVDICCATPDTAAATPPNRAERTNAARFAVACAPVTAPSAAAAIRAAFNASDSCSSVVITPGGTAATSPANAFTSVSRPGPAFAAARATFDRACITFARVSLTRGPFSWT